MHGAETGRGRHWWSRADVLVGVAAALALGYARVVRPRLTNLGATTLDRAQPLPLDEALPDAQVVTNRAIGVAAPPERVWPWIAQMGESPRGGFYSFTFVERLLGMRVSNATEILPEYQHPTVGEALDRGGNMRVKAVLEGECLVLGAPPGLDMDTTWAIAAVPDGHGGTRIISRCRVRYRRWTPAMVVGFLVLEWGQLLMEWQMLRVLKQRAESGA